MKRLTIELLADTPDNLDDVLGVALNCLSRNMYQTSGHASDGSAFYLVDVRNTGIQNGREWLEQARIEHGH